MTEDPGECYPFGRQQSEALLQLMQLNMSPFLEILTSFLPSPPLPKHGEQGCELVIAFPFCQALERQQGNQGYLKCQSPPPKPKAKLCCFSRFGDTY